MISPLEFALTVISIIVPFQASLGTDQDTEGFPVWFTSTPSSDVPEAFHP